MDQQKFVGVLENTIKGVFRLVLNFFTTFYYLATLNSFFWTKKNPRLADKIVPPYLFLTVLIFLVNKVLSPLVIPTLNLLTLKVFGEKKDVPIAELLVWEDFIDVPSLGEVLRFTLPSVILSIVLSTLISKIFFKKESSRNTFFSVLLYGVSFCYMWTWYIYLNILFSFIFDASSFVRSALSVINFSIFIVLVFNLKRILDIYGGSKVKLRYLMIFCFFILMLAVSLSIRRLFSFGVLIQFFIPFVIFYLLVFRSINYLKVGRLSKFKNNIVSLLLTSFIILSTISFNVFLLTTILSNSSNFDQPFFENSSWNSQKLIFKIISIEKEEGNLCKYDLLIRNNTDEKLLLSLSQTWLETKDGKVLSGTISGNKIDSMVRFDPHDFTLVKFYVGNDSTCTDQKDIAHMSLAVISEELKEERNRIEVRLD